MSPQSLREIQDHLSQILAAKIRKQVEDVGFVTLSKPGPPWPRIEHEILPKPPKELSSPTESTKEINLRLRKFLYPYPQGNKRGKTFHQHVKSLGLLNLITKPPLLWDIRFVWFDRVLSKHQRELKTKKLSQNKYPLRFHRDVMLRVFQHRKDIAKLSRDHGVDDREWFSQYYEALDQEIFREATKYYPEMRRWFIPAQQLSVRSLWVSTQLYLYEAIVKAFESKNIQNNFLAYQLTALFCSSRECIHAGKLDPDPERVRKYERDERKKQTRTVLFKRGTKRSPKPATNS